jgi:pseudouridine synthase
MADEPSDSAEGEPVKKKRAPARKPRKKAVAVADAAESAAPPEPAPPESEEVERHPSERLHKFLASTGAGSRRECETFIAQGRVTVNGKPITKMGFKVDPNVDRVSLDGEAVRIEEKVYYLLHKPSGFICTNADERGRPRAMDLIRENKLRIYTVGRLDADSLGLVLLTNDGAIANVICHPRYRIQKRYQVAVRGFVTREQVARLEAGVWLAEGKSSPAKVRPLGRNPKRNETILELTVFEGRNREIRRVFAKVGLVVRRLLRVSIGPIEIGPMQPGTYRRLEPSELAFVHEAERLYQANREAWDAELPPEKRRRPRTGNRPFGKGKRFGPRGRFDGPREGGPRDGGPREGGPGRGRFRRGPSGPDDRRAARPYGDRPYGDRPGGPPRGPGGPPAHDPRRRRRYY